MTFLQVVQGRLDGGFIKFQSELTVGLLITPREQGIE